MRIVSIGCKKINENPEGMNPRSEKKDEEKLERPRGLEPPPGAWQAPVLPLYYGRVSVSQLI
jgi:hypothetical protein